MISTRALVAIGTLIASSAAIVPPDGHTGKLPILGWNSWNAYHCDVNEDSMMQAAQALQSTGLQAAGYTFVGIDDCWSNKTGRVDGHIQPNMTSFPDGISGLATKIHDLKFSFGIYSCAGSTTCAGYPASLEYEDVDAADFASWGVDYLKYDNCNIPFNWWDRYTACDPDYVLTGANGTCNKFLDPLLPPANYNWTTSNSALRYRRMAEAIAQQEHQIVLSICNWGQADVFSWGNETGVSWRMSNDIQPDWKDVTRILNMNSFQLDSTDFWGHNDADMLEVGNGNLTPEETRSHFALWAAMKSPLLIGTDITKLSADNLAILKNSFLLAFNQDDQYGRPAYPYKWGKNPDYTFDDTYPAEYWAGESKGGTLVLMINTSDDVEEKTAVWTEAGLEAGNYSVTEVWSGKSLGCLSSYPANVSSHDTAAILVGAKC